VPVEPTTSDPTHAAREALERHAWDEAFELFSRADTLGGLPGPDLESLAEAAWFTAHADIGTDAKERAFKVYLSDGDKVRAAYLALNLTQWYAYQRKPSIASAWVRRGERLLEGEPECYAHGYFALCRSEGARQAGEVATAIELAEEAVQIGGRVGRRPAGHRADRPGSPAHRHRRDVGRIRAHGGSHDRSRERGGEGEIVVTVDTFDEADGVTTSEPREIPLKGVTEPVSVASVIWDSDSR